jgi:hypothetical protein
MTAYLLAALLAQSPAAPFQLPRADAHVVVGWQNLRGDRPQDDFNDWMNDIFYAGAGAGWHWTDHLKTQVDFGAGTKGRQYRYGNLVIDGRPAYQTSRVTVRQQSLAVAQQYQFFRNQWFHPRVGAGVDFARETTTEHYDSIFVFDNVTHVSKAITPPRTEGPEHDWVARPFAETGFKAYVTSKVFFTGDARIMFRSRIEEVLFRAGFGFDF